MVGWVTYIRNREFIGYGPFTECSHCDNKTWLEVWQSFQQMRPYTIIPLPRQFFDFVVLCHICHWGTTIKKKDKDQLRSVLEQGMTGTKSAFAKMGQNERERLLKNLNRNGFEDMARDLLFPGS